MYQCHPTTSKKMVQFESHYPATSLQVRNSNCPCPCPRPFHLLIKLYLAPRTILDSLCKGTYNYVYTLCTSSCFTCIGVHVGSGFCCIALECSITDVLHCFAWGTACMRIRGKKVDPLQFWNTHDCAVINQTYMTYAWKNRKHLLAT